MALKRGINSSFTKRGKSQGQAKPEEVLSWAQEVLSTVRKHTTNPRLVATILSAAQERNSLDWSYVNKTLSMTI